MCACGGGGHRIKYRQPWRGCHMCIYPPIPGKAEPTPSFPGAIRIPW